MKRPRLRALALASLALPHVGCGAMTELPLPDAIGERIDAGAPDASKTLQLQFVDIPDVDLVFVVDDSGSMRIEQAKLRAQFPSMVRALLTGNSDLSTPEPEWPPVNSLRIAVLTTDMGVAGVGTTPTSTTRIGTCGATATGIDAARARYGDDGRFRLEGRTIRSVGRVVVECDVAPRDGRDDSIPASALPSFLGFDNADGVTPTDAQLAEYARRASCFTNVGTAGCGFEQPLESMLKALTPANETDALPGGRFFAATGDANAGFGHGGVSDPFNGGWLRNDSLLAVVMVTDEDDCSSHDPRLFDYATTARGYDDPYDSYQSQSRCMRYDALVESTDRYVEGLLARRRGREHLLVFGAITGAPLALTDGMNAPSGVLEGTDNLPEILADPDMQTVLLTRVRPAGPGSSEVPVPGAAVRPACVHTVPRTRFTVTGDTFPGDSVVHGVVLGAPMTGTGIMATGRTMQGTYFVDQIRVADGSPELQIGDEVEGPGIPPGTLIVQLNGNAETTGPYAVLLSERSTRTATAVPLTIGRRHGPGVGQLITGPGIPFGTVVEDVLGTNPYEVTLNQAPTASASSGRFEMGTLDVFAVPARRITTVAEGLHAQGANVTVQSICADDFAPAVDHVLSLIQSNLAATCLSTVLPRAADQTVPCELTVTLPANEACATYPGLGAGPIARIPTAVPMDLDGFLEQCAIDQVPASPSSPPTGTTPGWFYDDFSAERVYCTSSERLSFTGGARPPRGSRFDFRCSL